MPTCVPRMEDRILQIVDAVLPEAKTFKIFLAKESQAATSVWKVFLQKRFAQTWYGLARPVHRGSF